MLDPALERNMRRRIFVMGFAGVFVAAGLILRAYDLQVRSADRLGALADRQHTAKVTLKARRGMIFDRNHAELAISLPVDSIFAQPGAVQDIKATSKSLAKALGLDDYKPLARRLAEPGRSFVWVARQVSADAVRRVRELDLPGIGFVEESKRHYPGGELAGHVIGFAGIDSVGLEGVEFAYDQYLRGNAEEVVGARDARGRAILARGVGSLERLQGDHLTLTLDSNIQHVAQRELQAGLEKVHAKAGTAIVMDPATGEVLAMAVEPRFDPNQFDKYTSAQFRNRAITDIYEPGSTMKAFLVSAAVESGAAEPSDIFFCENGEYGVYDRIFHDTKPHGWLSVSNILRVSSNIGAIKIADRVGGQNYYDYLRSFGFGRKTGIDLAGEADGLLSSPRNWSGVSLATIAFGQGIGVTPIQLATATAAIANGGVLVKPMILKEVRDAEGKIVNRTIPQVIDRVVSAGAARKVAKMMEGVVSPDGTGAMAQVPGYSVAGKTGTAQKIDREMGGYSATKRVVSFVGFVPAKDPRLAIVVLMDEPDATATGGAAAGPVFSRIASQAMAYLEVPPDQPFASVSVHEETSGSGAGTVQDEPSAAQYAWLSEEKKEWVHASNEGAAAPVGIVQATAAPGMDASGKILPSFSGMPLREVFRWQGASDVALRWQGHGVVVGQEPPPGTPLSPGMELRLVLRPPG